MEGFIREMEELIEINNKIIEKGRTYGKKRYIYYRVKREVEDKGKTFIGISGPRGSGKTILMAQLLNELKNSFYISLDKFPLSYKLFDFAKEMERRGIKYLIMDEITYYPNFEKELKNIYDFLNLKVIFSGSVAISLEKAKVDLSRRAKIIEMFPFSIPEYLYFKLGEKTDCITFEDFLNEKKARDFYGEIIRYEKYFREYIRGGLYPFTLESGIDMQLFNNIMNKIVSNDLVYSGFIERGEVGNVNDILRFIGLSSAEGISYSSISSNTGITKYKVKKYLEALEKSYLVNIVLPKGTNITKEPKVLISLPFRNVFNSNLEAIIGYLREDFFVESCKQKGIEISYLKSKKGEKVPDYYIKEKDIVIEIGGKGKSRRQFKGIEAKKKIILKEKGVVKEDERPLSIFSWICEEV